MSAPTPKATTRFLPVPLTPLVGRENELQMLRELLCNDDTRILTVTGTAGVGKTRLAVESARELAEGFAAGACFVPLAALGTPELVLPAIARTLGISESQHGEVLRDLAEQLASTDLLLLFENRDFAERYLNGMFADAVDGNPAFSEVRIEHYDVIEALSRITKGISVAAVSARS